MTRFISNKAAAMDFKKIFIAGTAGTVVMTLFSYAVTKAAKRILLNL